MFDGPLVLLLAILLAGASPLAKEGALAEKSRRGKELMAAGRFAEAAAVYRELVQTVPRNAGLLVNLGMALHQAGRDEEAIPPLESALRLDPNAFPAALFLGASNLRLGRMDAAVGPLQAAARLQPEQHEARSLLAEALLGLERYAEAEAHLRRLGGQAPSDPATWFNLGRTYEELAGQATRDLVKRSPESPYAVALFADARSKQDRNAAFHLYRQALDGVPTFRGLHTAIAGIYRSAGHADWAVVEDEKERRLPKPHCPRERLECAFSAGRHREVVASASRLKSPEAGYWLVRAYNALAEEAFARLLALPPSALGHERRAEVHRDARRWADSADEWRKATSLSPEDTRLKMELAVTLRLGGDFAGAQKVLEDVLSTGPDAFEPNDLLGDVLLAQQQPERAIAPLEKAVRMAPERPHAHGALGRAYALTGRPAEAVPHLEQALPADVDGSLRLQLARAYQAAGQAEKAQAALKDYEEFRRARPADSEGSEAPPLVPPR